MRSGVIARERWGRGNNPLVPATIEDQAICVRVWDWSETSQTISIFSRSLGLLRCLAKGAKRPKANFSGGIELLTVADIAVQVKAGRELNLLTRWDLLEVFPSLRRELSVHYAGLYMAELVQRLAADHDPHPGVFDALLQALRGLTSAAAVHNVLMSFQWAILSQTGYQPLMDRSLSGEELPVAAAYQFDPARGGFIGAADMNRGDPDWMLRRATLEALRRLSGADAAGAAHQVDADTASRTARFLAAYTRFLLGAQPATLPLIFPDLAARSPGRA
jgi:DNA repair protein RecO (recombination protein O)